MYNELLSINKYFDLYVCMQSVCLFFAVIAYLMSLQMHLYVLFYLTCLLHHAKYELACVCLYVTLYMLRSCRLRAHAYNKILFNCLIIYYSYHALYI